MAELLEEHSNKLRSLSAREARVNERETLVKQKEQ